MKTKLIKAKIIVKIVFIEMDYRRPPSNRVKIAPARFRSNEENLEKVKEKNEQKEETNNSKTINRKRKFIEQSKGEIL